MALLDCVFTRGGGRVVYLWVKAFHIIFMVCWFAGIFYLPRLFVHHAMSEDAPTRERLAIMEGKLYRFVTPFMALTLLLGVWMLWLAPGLLSQGWMHGKLALVALLVFYHFRCGQLVRALAQGPTPHSHRYYRIFNELPVLALFPIVLLVVLKPF